MKKKNRGIMAMLVAVCMLLVLLGGCSNTDNTSSDPPSQATPEVTSESPVAVSEESEQAATQDTAQDALPDNQWSSLSSTGGYLPGAASLSYPIEGGKTLSIWGSISPMITEYLDDWNDQVVVQEYEKQTGVHLKYQYYTSATASESFNLMIAGGDYPDMIQGFTGFYSNGVDNAIEEEVILPLEDYIEEFCPDYWRCITDNNMVADQYSDNGHVGGVAGFESAYTGPMEGPMIRNDWLKDLGLEAPRTYDEYYSVLSAFKAEYDCSAPLLLTGGTQSSNWLVGGYGVAGYTDTTMYQVDGNVYSSLTQDSYREYLMMLNQWYESGLIYADFYSLDASIMNTDTASYLYRGESGIFYGMTTQMPTYLDSLELEEGDIIAIEDARSSADEIMHFGGYPVARSGQQISVTTNCEDLELALRWLNYGFTEEGYWLLNYGVDGVSYTMGEDGLPVMTDTVVNSTEFNVSVGMALYTWPQIPCLQDAYRNYNTIFTATQKSTWDTWSGCIDGAYELPTSLSLTEDESTQFSLNMAEIETYCDTMILKFVIGDESFDKWDEYVEMVNSFGLNECVAIYQNAYDRYVSR